MVRGVSSAHYQEESKEAFEEESLDYCKRYSEQCSELLLAIAAKHNRLKELSHALDVAKNEGMAGCHLTGGASSSEPTTGEEEKNDFVTVKGALPVLVEEEETPPSKPPKNCATATTTTTGTNFYQQYTERCSELLISVAEKYRRMQVLNRNLDEAMQNLSHSNPETQDDGQQQQDGLHASTAITSSSAPPDANDGGATVKIQNHKGKGPEQIIEEEKVAASLEADTDQICSTRSSREPEMEIPLRVDTHKDSEEKKEDEHYCVDEQSRGFFVVGDEIISDEPSSDISRAMEFTTRQEVQDETVTASSERDQDPNSTDNHASVDQNPCNDSSNVLSVPSEALFTVDDLSDDKGVSNESTTTSSSVNPPLSEEVALNKQENAADAKLTSGDEDLPRHLEEHQDDPSLGKDLFRSYQSMNHNCADIVQKASEDISLETVESFRFAVTSAQDQDRPSVEEDYPPTDWQEQVRALQEQLQDRDQALNESREKNAIMEVTVQALQAQVQTMRHTHDRKSSQAEVEQTNLKEIIKSQRALIQDLQTQLRRHKQQQQEHHGKVKQQKRSMIQSEDYRTNVEEARQDHTPPRGPILSPDEEVVADGYGEDDLQVFQRVAAVKASLEELQSGSHQAKVRNAILTEELAICRRNVHNHKYIPDRSILDQVSSRLQNFKSHYCQDCVSHDVCNCSLPPNMTPKLMLPTPPPLSGAMSSRPLAEQVASLISTVKKEEQYMASLVRRLHEKRNSESNPSDREPASPPRTSSSTSAPPAKTVANLLAEKEQYMNEITASLQKFNSNATIPVSLYQAEMAQLRECIAQMQHSHQPGDEQA